MTASQQAGPTLVKKGVAHFSSDAQLLAELGERLVAAAHVALAEIVKNAHDADATTAHIWLTDESEPVLNVADTRVMQSE